ncbi:MAG: alpha/beta hydrolase [bacterium]|nr:alpha/beta hydrolase [bacterium]
MKKVFLYSLMLSVVLASLLINAGPVSAEAAKVLRDIEYTVYQGSSMQLDIYLPATEGPYPLIVWLHGGAFRMGNRTWIEQGALDQVSRGYALASVSYSFSQTAQWPVQAYQIKAAIRWLRAHAAGYNVDPDKFIAWGMSAGGHLASIAGTSGDEKRLEDLTLGNSHYSSRVQAVVSWYGPSDFLRMGGSHDNADSPESELVGCPVQTCPEKTARANPVTYITPDDPPFYIMHGTGDSSVPHSQSVILYDALQQAGVTATFISLPDYVHSDPRFNTGSRIAGVQEFLDTLFAQ